jgi:transcriptional regulator with XRE-family HTH domain
MSVLATRFPAQQFVDDIIVGDRRLAERSDVKAYLEPGGDSPHPIREILSLNVGKNTTLFIKIISSKALSQLELQQIKLLEALLIYAGSKDRSLAVQIGEVLRQVRHSLNLSQEELAVQAGTTRFGVWKWESGAQAPSIPTLYRWCQTLGLVCPPQTALVRVVDFSPDLLRFLQEDPTRLRSLTPDVFERFVAERMDRMGYNVTLTGATNRKDGGIDLIAVPKLASLGSYVIAGQVKHHQGVETTGVDAVDRLLAWKDSVFRAGLLVTNTSFTSDAVWKAHKDGNAHFLRLRDFTDLKRWLQDQYGSEEDWREIPDQIELAPGVVIDIPRPRITSVFQDQRVLRDASQVKNPRTKRTP